MFTNLYNKFFGETLENQVRRVQKDKIDILIKETVLDLDLLKKIKTTKRPMMTINGYNDSNEWRVVIGLPKNYHIRNNNRGMLKRYILTNFRISNLSYQSFRFMIDDNVIIEDNLHPWSNLWKDNSVCDSMNLKYLKFPIQELNNQSIKFEFVYSKSVLEDPKDLYIEFDINRFHNKRTENIFYNAWTQKTYNIITPVILDTKNNSLNLNDLDKNTKLHQMVFESPDGEYPLKNIELIDYDDNVIKLDPWDYEQSGSYYKIKFSKDIVNGLNNNDWKEIIFNFDQEIKNVKLLTTRIIRFKNNRLSEI